MEQSVKLIESLIKKYNSKKYKPVFTIDEIPEAVEYYPGVGRLFKKGKHYGQRKLLLSEVQFLTQHPNKYFVYAGAAPSHKGLMLAKLFPNIKMLFFDPRPFQIYINEKHEIWDESEHPIIKKCDVNALDDITTNIDNDSHQLFLFNAYFTDDVAVKLSKVQDDLSFMSDIRTKRNEKHATAPVDIDILWNLAQQFIWTKLTNAKASCLKFRQIFYDQKAEDFERLAKTEPYMSTFSRANQLGIDFVHDYNAGELHYPEGISYLQAWPGQSSTEVRLHLLRDAKIIDHDLHDFEDKLHFYNCVYRMHANISDYPEFLGIDAKKCYDASNDLAIETKIWKDYLEHAGQPSKKSDIKKMVEKLSEFTKTLCDENTSSKHGGAENTAGILVILIVLIVLILLLAVQIFGKFGKFTKMLNVSENFDSLLFWKK